jgi:hypothetical protein
MFPALLPVGSIDFTVSFAPLFFCLIATITGCAIAFVIELLANKTTEETSGNSAGFKNAA